MYYILHTNVMNGNIVVFKKKTDTGTSLDKLYNKNKYNSFIVNIDISFVELKFCNIQTDYVQTWFSVL